MVYYINIKYIVIQVDTFQGRDQLDPTTIDRTPRRRDPKKPEEGVLTLY